MQRDAEVLRLRVSGLTYAQIAGQLGWANKSGAYHAVRRAIADSHRLPRAEAAKAEEERLDYLTRTLTRLAAGHGCDADVISASLALLKVSESRRRLLGLDQPMRRTVEVITEDQVDAEIRRLEGKLAAPG
jgi:hypothetical protein